jgi:hypothetical protein
MVSEDKLGEHMAKVEARYALGGERLQARADIIESRAPVETRARLLNQAIASSSRSQGIMWLRRSTDVMLKAAAGVVACKDGCSHCCHIDVTVAESEAALIGKAIDRQPDRTAGVHINDIDTQAYQRRFFGVPCPFLENSRCSIYEHRPLSCRRHVSLDDDDLLCQLVPGGDISTPNIDMRVDSLAYGQVVGAGAALADIREWFPADSRARP